MGNCDMKAPPSPAGLSEVDRISEAAARRVFASCGPTCPTATSTRGRGTWAQSPPATRDFRGYRFGVGLGLMLGPGHFCSVVLYINFRKQVWTTVGKSLPFNEFLDY